MVILSNTQKMRWFESVVPKIEVVVAIVNSYFINIAAVISF